MHSSQSIYNVCSILLAALLHAALAGYALVRIERVFHEDLVFRTWVIFLTFCHDCKLRLECTEKFSWKTVMQQWVPDRRCTDAESFSRRESDILFCMSVCLSARITRKPPGLTSPDFCARCLCPWLGPSPVALRQVMHFRFHGWRYVFIPRGQCVRVKLYVLWRYQVALPVGRQTTAMFGWVLHNVAPQVRSLLSIRNSSAILSSTRDGRPIVEYRNCKWNVVVFKCMQIYW